MIQIIKKDGSLESFNPRKIWSAIDKSAARVFINFTDEEHKKISNWVKAAIKTEQISVSDVHNLVEMALDACGFNQVAESYRSYRNYKRDQLDIMAAEELKEIELNREPDRSNANCNSQLISTKKILKYGAIQEAKYMRFFLTPEERKATEDGYIYPHDKKDRLETYNCCLLNVGRVMKGGFKLANIDYTEPGSVASAIAVASDIISVTAGNQYGGLTWPQVDEDLAPYCQKSYDFYFNQRQKELDKSRNWIERIYAKLFKKNKDKRENDEYAYERVKREIEQGYQGIEHTYNSVQSCRGDYPFISFSLGHGSDRWSRLITKTILEVRMKGQGKPGGKIPVLFPKIIFTYKDELHGQGKPCEDVFLLACKCSKDTMYPDFMSLDAGYEGDMYKKHGVIITKMGCRATLSPDFDDEGNFLLYRCNLGVISLNLPMIYQKAKVENKNFFEVFDYYLELSRNIHKRTIEYLSKLKASGNPLAFMEGGFDGGYLDANDSIAPVLKHSTISFGYGGLAEIQLMETGIPYEKDQSFAMKVMKYFNKKVEQFKKQDNILYAIYGTPGESWLPLACQQFVKKYGEIEWVTTKGFFTNSFHVNVDADVTPIEKIDIENEFFPLSKGGSICHVKIPSIDDSMLPAVASIIRHAMSVGNYQSVNHNQNRCADCGHHWIGDDTLPDEENYKCPKCGSYKTVGIRRMNGYLGFSKTTLGYSKFNDGKLKEFKFRKNI